jgi:hypothetical protein
VRFTASGSISMVLSQQFQTRTGLRARHAGFF